MNTAHLILGRVLVREFYRSNASFFLVVIALAGGFMRGIDHIILAELCVSSFILLSIPIFVWSLYMLKIVAFNRSAVQKTENQFLLNFIFLRESQKWRALMFCCSVQFTPAVAYGLFLLATAWKHQFWYSFVIIILSLIILIAICAYRLYSVLHYPATEKKISWLKSIIDLKIRRPYPLIAFEWVCRNQTFMVLFTKLFAGLLLYGVLILYTTDEYDGRLLAMGVIISFAASAPLLLEVHRFENFHLKIYRQLPLSLYARTLFILLIILILCIPEIILITRNFPDNLPVRYGFSVVFFGLSLLLLLYSILYIKSRELEKFTSIIFSISVTAIILVLFKTPIWILTVVNFTLTFYLVKRFYYRFEYLIEND